MWRGQCEWFQEVGGRLCSVADEELECAGTVRATPACGTLGIRHAAVEKAQGQHRRAEEPLIIETFGANASGER